MKQASSEIPALHEMFRDAFKIGAPSVLALYLLRVLSLPSITTVLLPRMK